MRVLHVIIGLRVGGAEMMLLKLLRQMDCAEFEPMVAAFIDGGPCAASLQEIGVPVRHLGMNHVWQAPMALMRLHQVAREFAPDVVQGWMYHGNIAATIVAGQLTKQPDLYWNIRHSLSDPTKEKFLTRRLIELGARWSGRPRKVVHNAAISIEQHGAVGFRRDNALMIPNGFELEKFYPSPEARVQMRRELGLSQDSVLVGNLGRYHPMKAQGDFIMAAAKLAETHPTAHFLLGGRDVTTNNARLQEFVAASGVAEKFHLLGPQENPARFLAALDLYCLSSSYGEGFPNVLGEAMSCGVPCVTTEVGEAKEIVGSLGVVAPVSDPAALAAAMELLLARIRDEGEQLGDLCRASIGERYDLNTIADLYAAMYHRSKEF